jgi:hypothetical protein
MTSLPRINLEDILNKVLRENNTLLRSLNYFKLRIPCGKTFSTDLSDMQKNAGWKINRGLRDLPKYDIVIDGLNIFGGNVLYQSMIGNGISSSNIGRYKFDVIKTIIDPNFPHRQIENTAIKNSAFFIEKIHSYIGKLVSDDSTILMILPYHLPLYTTDDFIAYNLFTVCINSKIIIPIRKIYPQFDIIIPFIRSVPKLSDSHLINTVNPDYEQSLLVKYSHFKDNRRSSTCTTFFSNDAIAEHKYCEIDDALCLLFMKPEGLIITKDNDLKKKSGSMIFDTEAHNFCINWGNSIPCLFMGHTIKSISKNKTNNKRALENIHTQLTKKQIAAIKEQANNKAIRNAIKKNRESITEKKKKKNRESITVKNQKTVKKKKNKKKK